MRAKSNKLTEEKLLLAHEKGHLLELTNRNKTRDAILIETAIYTGARESELIALTTSDLNPHKRTVFIRGLKGSDDRSICLSKLQWARLMTIVPAADGRLFPISARRVRQIWDFWRVGDKHFHSLRHTFAVDFYKLTRDIKLTQMALGHRSLNSTKVYLDYVYELEELHKYEMGAI